MDSPLFTLVRKDARELRGKVGAMTLILASAIVATLGHDLDDAVGVANVFLGVYAVVGAIFFAMTIASGERAQATLAFTRAMPVSRSAIAASRVGVGLIACLVPIVVAVIALGVGLEVAERFIESGSRGWPYLWSPSNLARSAGVALGSATMVYLLAVVAGAHQASELRAAAWGLGALVAWFIVLPFLMIPRASAAVLMTSPIGLLLAAKNNDLWWTTIIVQVAVDLVLLGLALKRYGQLGPARHRRTAPARGHLVRRFGNPFTALIWKEGREAMPIIALGLLVTALLTTLIVVAETHNMTSSPLQVIERTLSVVTYGLATLVALIVGVGTFVSELQPGLHEFWRTRPIGVTRWYCMKTVTAAAILLIAFTTPIIVVLAIDTAPSTHDGVAFLACAPPLILFCLTATIAVTCLARHALYASILSTAVVLAVVIVPTYGSALAWLDIGKISSRCMDLARDGLDPFQDTRYRVYLASMLGLAAGAAGLGLAAVRRNWDLSRSR